jgi:hypothetical protein
MRDANQGVVYDIRKLHTRASSSLDVGEPERVQAEWRERIVTGVATSITVLIVATVAVPMGMALAHSA